MKQDNVTVSFDAAKLKAIKLYMSRKGVSLEQELVEQLNKLYEKYVPVNVRDYIAESESGEAGNVQPRQAK
jgi:hypothetical protein